MIANCSKAHRSPLRTATRLASLAYSVFSSSSLQPQASRLFLACAGAGLPGRLPLRGFRFHASMRSSENGIVPPRPSIRRSSMLASRRLSLVSLFSANSTKHPKRFPLPLEFQPHPRLRLGQPQSRMGSTSRRFRTQSVNKLQPRIASADSKHQRAVGISTAKCF